MQGLPEVVVRESKKGNFGTLDMLVILQPTLILETRTPYLQIADPRRKTPLCPQEE